MLRIGIIVMAVIIAGLAVSSAVLLTAAAHDKPLHRAYACAYATDLRHRKHISRRPRAISNQPSSGRPEHSPQP